ncbi:Protein yippee-like [Beauveria bassiana]|nr:Protein yippee-like [Beauveria bassiana]KAH8715684.1 Protein yippee-like [Beauveria bassiana]
MHNRSTSDTTRGSHRISATPPIFPTYLLPSFKFPFLRRRVSASSSSSSASHPSSSTKSTSSPAGAGRLQRLGPDTLRCSACSADLALAAQIISKGFTGRYGRALLVAPPPPPPPATSAAEEDDYDSDSGSPPLLNIRIGRLENRQLVTGWHVVADISCSSCSRKLGWKYVDAKEKSQKYKVGKYILETERVTTHRSWGDEDGDDGASGALVVVDGGPYGTRRRMSSDRVSFDSEDDDECDDVFAGTWNARTVARRRAELIAAVRSDE